MEQSTLDKKIEALLAAGVDPARIGQWLREQG